MCRCGSLVAFAHQRPALHGGSCGGGTEMVGEDNSRSEGPVVRLPNQLPTGNALSISVPFLPQSCVLQDEVRVFLVSQAVHAALLRSSGFSLVQVCRSKVDSFYSSNLPLGYPAFLLDLVGGDTSRGHPMAQEHTNSEQVVLGEEVKHVRLLTLNRPRQLNVLSSKVVALLAEILEKWEKDDGAELVIVKGAGRAFSAGGDLKMFYEGRSDDSCLEVVYRMYWLCYHLHTYQKTWVSLVHGIVMGGGGALTVPAKFSVVTEKTVFAVPEASIGHHTDCSFSYILSRLPGSLGEFLALTGARLNGKEMIAAGLATHFVPSEKLLELEEHLLNLNTGNESKVKMAIEEYAINVQPEEESVLNKISVINKCFCKETIEEIINSVEVEASIEGNGWIGALLKGLKRSSPTGLKITLRSIREGREQTLAECLKKEFRLTMNILRSVISGDVYEGIRALTIDKDNAPKWNPATLEEVSSGSVDIVFKPFKDELELSIPSEGDGSRWDSKYEDSIYPKLHRASA